MTSPRALTTGVGCPRRVDQGALALVGWSDQPGRELRHGGLLPAARPSRSPPSPRRRAPARTTGPTRGGTRARGGAAPPERPRPGRGPRGRGAGGGGGHLSADGGVGGWFHEQTRQRPSPSHSILPTWPVLTLKVPGSTASSRAPGTRPRNQRRRPLLLQTSTRGRAARSRPPPSARPGHDRSGTRATPRPRPLAPLAPPADRGVAVRRDDLLGRPPAPVPVVDLAEGLDPGRGRSPARGEPEVFHLVARGR